MREGLCWKSEFAPLAMRHGERIAVTDDRGPVSYAALFDHAAGIAARLVDLGVASGAPVATWLPNSRDAVAASYGITLAGACDTPINPYLSIGDVRHCLATARAEIIVIDAARRSALEDLGAHVLVAEEVAPVAFRDLPPRAVSRDLWGRIIFTSGTTGRPKGIVYSHGGRWLANLLLRANLPIAARPGRNVLLLTPFSHGASLMAYALLDGGASVTLLDGVDVNKVEDLIARRAVDQLFAPPTVLAKLMQGFEGKRFEGIEAIFCGTAPLSAELYAGVRATFGPVVRITFGKSEVFNPITILTPEETDDWYRTGDTSLGACVGWPASGVEIRIAEDERDEGGDPSPPGPVLIRARHMLAGTLIDGRFEPHPPEAFHRSGDIGLIDARGRLILAGREADLMKTGGYRVTPDEVEAALRPLLAKGEVAVVGLPSAYWGEVITAVAVGAETDWRERMSEAIGRMTPYKRPRLFADLDEMPRNAMGKVVRAKIRDEILARYAFEDGQYPALSPHAAPSREETASCR